MINLGVLFDIPLDRARDAVTRNAEACVVHGDIRARVHKGIARVIPAGVTSTDQAATSDMKESMEI